MTNGYNFYFKDGENVLTFPITPSELSIKVGSNNEVVSLISEGDINILKSPSLIEVEFEARFPMRKYPYSREVSSFEEYFKVFEELKEKKKSFRFIVARTTPQGKRTWDTNLLVALESFELTESADEGDDVLVSFTLKQYKEYGVRTINVPSESTSKPTTTSTSEKPRSTENKASTSTTHKVKSGDNLWSIAKKYYGNGALYKSIYTANKNVIEDAAKKHGKASSREGHWIWSGTVLTIPDLATAKSSAAKTDTPKQSSSAGSKTNPPFAILVNDAFVFKRDIKTWEEAYEVYTTVDGKNKGWKIVDKNGKVINV